jgi:thiaminase/transcriptional activator TenA
MVHEIGDGSLAREKFRFYFEQNILYLGDYARAIALIIGKAPDEGAIEVLTRFLVRIVQEEIPANHDFLSRLGGDTAELDPLTSMHETTYGYTRHLLHVAAQGDCAEGLTAVLPCQWSYGELAKRLVLHTPSDPVYADWIHLFGDPGYDEMVRDTSSLLDRLVDPGDVDKLRGLLWVFDTSTRYEAKFWDMAYAGPA